MKLKNILLTALMAVVSIASANAKQTYNEGDILLGFSSSSATSDYVVNLGNISDLLSLTSKTWAISTSDLTNTFSSTWYSDSSVSWGAIASVDSTTQVYVTNNAQNVGDNLSAVTSDVFTLSSQYVNGTKTAGSTASLVSVTISNTTGYSWTDYTNINFDALTTSPIAALDGAVSSLGLYYQDPSAAAGSPATQIGTLSLADDGTLTFAAVPEPSTYAMMALGGLGMLRMVRRRRVA